MYAPASYVSAAQLKEAIPLLQFSDSYALSKRTAAPIIPLASKVMVKFVSPEAERPTLDDLTQIEFIEVEANRPDILKMYQEGLYQAKLGRISLVPNGQIAHNWVVQVEHFSKSAATGIEISELMQQPLKTEAVYKKLGDLLTDFQDYVASMGELRKKNGFTARENAAYGRFLTVHLDLCRLYLNIMSADTTADPTVVAALKPGSEIFQKVFALQSARINSEFGQDSGPNYPVELKRIGVRDFLAIR